jgi:hypothetical protein
MIARELKVQYVVTLEATAGADDIRALRLFLKRALRSCGLRCSEVRQINHDDGGERR